VGRDTGGGGCVSQPAENEIPRSRITVTAGCKYLPPTDTPPL
jgi:hypothetical protein